MPWRWQLKPALASVRASTRPFMKADCGRALLQLSTTGVLFLAVMGAMLTALGHGAAVAMLLAPIGSVLLLRLFIFQHDCGHGSFFPSPRLNNLVGGTLGVLTLTPYTFWRGNHAIHHATTGNLDRRGIGDVKTLTVSEYLALSKWRRLAYRAYRHPLVLFGAGPAWLFLVEHRLPPRHPRKRWRDWMSVLGTDLAVAFLLAALVLTFGPVAVLLGWLPVILMTATIGVWLFYIQHQFEEAYWEHRPQWEFHAAALQGASFYDLPRVLHWATGNIGFHHIHHLACKIPNYRLRECHEANAFIQAGCRLTLRESLKCARLALWDEAYGRLVPFSAVRRWARVAAGERRGSEPAPYKIRAAAE